MPVVGDWVVMKFGGTSVARRQNWETIATVARQRLADGLRPVVVCSALAGITNDLEALLAEPGNGKQEEVLTRIQNRHRELAEELGVDYESLLGAPMNELARLSQGAALLGEVSPRVHARVLACGELMSTRLGAAFLTQQGLSTYWLDARDALTAEEDPRRGPRQAYLAASCHVGPDPVWQERLAAQPEQLVLTQGFIARNGAGDTVLLGRGGSDTSAAYFAALLAAKRCEIWTDVPGIFTADPRDIPTARLLHLLDYDEAQEITTLGAKVLHPRCIRPLADHNIPIHILCTHRPEIEGTVITAETPPEGALVKAVAAKYNLTLISLETLGMWHQVGFLADVFACFQHHGLSVDQVSTSETNITVSLDAAANVLGEDTLAPLMGDLARIGQVKKIGPCASVSLIGRHIRTILHELAPALEVFGESKIHMVTQASNDLNLTFIVDEAQAERMVDRLHHLLFEGGGHSQSLLGPTWAEIFDEKVETKIKTPRPWWRKRRAELLALAAQDTPLYVYDEASLETTANQLLGLKSVDRIFYSIKANAFPPILRLFEQRGLGFECVSPGEIALLRQLFPALDGNRILFTPNFAAREEYEQALQLGVIVTLDNLFPLEHWPQLFAEQEVFVRVDPGQGRGHHHHVKTAGTRSKFGVTREEFARLVSLARENGTRICGLHAHTGSGILEHENWQEVASFLGAMGESLPDVRVLDLGGGLGVVEKPGQTALDLGKLDKSLRRFKAAYPQFELWIEPGRYLVAEAGALLARVTQTKRKLGAYYVGVNAGMNSLLRPALYGSYHEIVNLTRAESRERVKADIVGPICESGDVLGHDRDIAPAREGDVMLVATVGAYGYSMASNYNLRPPPKEVMLPAPPKA